MWNRIRALIVKELLAVWKDPRSRAVMIGPPLIQLLVFGYAASFDLNDIKAAVYNEDNGSASRELISRFTGAPAFGEVRHLTRAEQFAPLIDDKSVLVVLHVGQDFSANLQRRKPASLQVIVDGRNSNTALLALGYVNAIVDGFNRDWMRDHRIQLPPGRIVVRAWYNPNLESRWFFIPGLVALITMLVATVVTALSVAREREIGTFEQVLIAPFRPAEILIGKSVPAVLIGFGEATFITLVAVFWFGVPLLGNIALLLAGIFVFLLAVVGVGLMVSSLARTQQQAIFGAFLFLVPSVILSGFATPIANMPAWVQTFTLANPMRYALEIVRGLFLQDMAPDLVFDRLWPLGVIALVTLTVAGWLFRRRME